MNKRSIKSATKLSATVGSKAGRRLTAALLAGSALVTPSLAIAQVITWDGSTSADYNIGENWSGGAVPVSTSIATINATGTAPQPVLSGDGTVADVQTIFVGEINTGSLVVQDGAVLNVGLIESSGQRRINVGGGGNDLDASRFGNGTLTITGAGSQVQGITLLVGQGESTRGLTGNASGLVEVLDGGTLRLRNGFTLGNAVLATGSPRGVLRVSGAGSTLDFGTSNNTLRISGPGSLLEILDGGRMFGNANWGVANSAAVRISGLGADANFGNSIGFTTRAGDSSDVGLLVENNGILRVNNLSLSGTGPNSGNAMVRSGGQILANAVFIDAMQFVVDGGTLSGTQNIRISNNLGSRLIFRNGASVAAGSLSSFSANGEIFFGGLDTDAPSAMGSYNVRNLDIPANNRVVFNHSGGPLTINSDITNGGLIQHIAGTTIFTGGGSFEGETRLTGGTILVNGSYGGGFHRMSVSGGTTLGGSGTLRGNLTVADGRIAPGNSAGNFTILGGLVLGANSILDYELGAPSGVAGVASDLITVGGNLTLDGTLNITNVGGFGAGLYRLIDYTGMLTDNGLLVGATPTGFVASDLTVQTSVARQVNLLVNAPVAPGIFNFWDGSNTAANNLIDGGTGTWTATGGNWTSATGAANGAYDPTQLLIFSGTGGVVTINNGAGAVSAPIGLQFASDGYRVGGGALDFGNRIANIRVGDGSAAGGAFTTTIASALTGATGLLKTDLGTLALAAATTVSGRVDIRGGTVAIGNGGSLTGMNINIGDQGAAIATVSGGGSVIATATTTVGGSISGGSTTSGNGSLLISGVGSQFSASRLLVGFGNGTTGATSVTDGGVLTSASGEIGNANATATITISGAGSRWDVTGVNTGNVRLGLGTSQNSRGSLAIIDGGVMTLAAGFSLRVSEGSDLRVSGANSRIDGGTTSLLTLAADLGGSVLLENGGVLRIGMAQFAGTSSLTINSGGRLETIDGNSLQFSSGARLLVTGTGSRITSGGPISISGNGAAQDILFDDNAIVTVTRDTDSVIGGANATGGSRRFIISNGAQLNLAGGLNLGNTDLTVSNAVVNMAGGFVSTQAVGSSTIRLQNADFTARSFNLSSANDRLVIGADVGEAAAAAGRFNVTGSLALAGVDTTVVLNHTDTGYTIASIFGGAGVIRHLAGDTRLTGIGGGFGGRTLLSGGTLAVDGTFSTDSRLRTTVSGGATLSGRGTIAGTVTVEDGIIRPGGDLLSATGPLLGGNAIGNLTFANNLALGSASQLAFQLGAPDSPGVGSDLITVTGNLTLDGTLNITDVGGFGAGLYRLINYGGLLSDNGLELGSLPAGFSDTDLEVQTSVARQVNLIVATPPAPTSFPFWDGSATVANGMIKGGTGTWTATGSNWTTTAATANGAYNPEDLLIFTGPMAGEVDQGQTAARVTTQVTAAVPSASAGTVTVDDSAGAITLENGMQFAVTGYTLTGDDIVLAATVPCGECTPLPGQTIVRVGDGTDASTGFVTTIQSRLTGESGLLKTDRGTLILAGANTYSGGTEIADGKLQGDTTSLQGDIAIGSGGTLLFTQGDDGEFSGVLSGAGIFAKQNAGVLRVTADSSTFDGTSVLTGGELAVDGTLGSALSTMQVGGVATLSGAGRIGGSVAVDDAVVSPGGMPVAPPEEQRFAAALAATTSPVGLLTIDGNFSLTNASILAFQLGDPAGEAGVASDLINVGGNLTLDGTLNVRDAGGFGAGLYRLINYGGTLTDNGLGIGITPDGFIPADLTVQTSVANQVNLLVGAPITSFTFWDGTNIASNGVVDGGTGTWRADTTNWSIASGSRNGVVDPSQLLVFAGTAGTVTVDTAGGAVNVGNGMQFATHGYSIAGGPIALTSAQATVRVGDGTATGAGFTATIASVLTGAAQVSKTDLGTLVLAGANTYSGGTRVLGGTLQIAADSALGAASGGVELNGGTLSTTAALTSARGFTIGSGGGTIDSAANALTLSGSITGSGNLALSGIGLRTFTGNSGAFTGATTLAAGMLALPGTLGGLVTVAAPATLTGTGRAGSLDLAGTLSPGAAAGATATFNVTGDLTIRAGSTLRVDLAANGATDRLDVGGRATLQGGTVAVTTLDPDLNYTNGAVYRIVNAAGGLTGTFAGLTETSAFLDFGLGYDPTGAFLRTTVIRQFPDVAQTFNQVQAASALKDLGRVAGSDSLAVFNTILLLDADPARAAFDASSGEIYPTLLAGRQRAGLALAGRIALRGSAKGSEGLAIWGGVLGERSHVDGDGNGTHSRADSFGLESGLDYRGPDNQFAIGVAGGWQDGDVTLRGRASRAKIDAWHIGGYARYGSGAAGLSAVVSVVHANADAAVTRQIGFGAISRTASANVDLRTTAAGGEIRLGLGGDALAVGPLVSIDHASTRLGRVAETGASTLNLSGAGKRESWTRYGAGGFARYDLGSGFADVSVRYVNRDRLNTGVSLAMAGSPTGYEVRAAAGSRGTVRVDARTEFAIGERWSISGMLGGSIANKEGQIDGNLRLSYRF